MQGETIDEKHFFVAEIRKCSDFVSLDSCGLWPQ